MPERFDEAIDRAVRDMLDVEPRADLRARVIAQVSASGSQLPAFGFRRNRWIVLPLAAAAALLLLVARLSWRAETPASAPAMVAHAPDQHLPYSPSVQQPVSAPRAARPKPATEMVRTSVPASGTRETAPVIAAAFTEPEQATTEIAPMKPMTPIAVAPVTQDRIAPASQIALHPLNTIDEIQIAPLTPPDRR